MRKNMRKWLSLLLALTTCLSLLSVGVLASEEPVETEAPAETEAEETTEAENIPPLEEGEGEEPTEEAIPTAEDSPAEESDAGETPEAENSGKDANALPEDEPAEEIKELSELAETVSLTAANAATTSGTCGDNVTWTLENGVLTISGEGEIELEPTKDAAVPWADYCESITSVVIESGVTMVYLRGFNECRNLAKITVPDSVSIISVYGFSGGASLTAINVADGNAEYASEDGVLYNKDKTALYQYPAGKTDASFLIPDGVMYICDYAFVNCTNLTSVTIPDSVTYIDDFAFSGCTGLTSITVPASVVRIFYGAFSGCTKLENVTFEGDNTDFEPDAFADTPWLAAQGEFLIVNNELVKYLGESAAVTIPDGVTKILQDAFYGCESLTSVTIPSSVTNIQEYAFGDCTNLTEVNLPDSVIIDGVSAFGTPDGVYAPWLEKQKEKQGDFLILGASLLAYRGSDSTVTIPDGVKGIGYKAFWNCASLTSVTIPSSVTSIRGLAFYGCAGLTSVTIPDSVTDLGWNVFNGCTSLVSATLPSGLTEVPPGTFCGCTNLKDVNIPSGVTEIGIGAFEGCTSLTEIALPEGLTNINGGAFQKCAGLTEATIPASVTDIAYSAFKNCTSLKAVTFDGDAPSVYVYMNGDEIKPFTGVTAMAVYYENTDGWTGEAKAAFGGNLTWVGLASIYLYNNDRSFSIAKEDGTAWDSGITLSVTSAENAEMSDAEIAEYGIGQYTAYNIRLLKDGKEIQPDGSVRVCLPVPEGYDGSSCTVFRMESGGTLTKLETTYNAEDDTLTFVTDHFSIYLVAETKQPRKPGDINGDGSVNNKDLNRLMKYLLNNSTVIVKEALDVNGDGSVNNKDLNRLMKYLLNNTIEIY